MGHPINTSHYTEQNAFNSPVNSAKSNNTALITGASSGLGIEFARLHARAGGDMVLLARREAPMQALKQELEEQYGVRVWVLVADLSQAQAVSDVLAAVHALDLRISVLINNAGMGGYGLFHERDWAKEQQALALNITALSALTHAFLPDMLQQGRGRILNVASVAGLLPGPWQAVYYASKAYVVSFSQALAYELKDTGVSVTTLCPGPVATNFVAASGLPKLQTLSHAASASQVAHIGYLAMEQGKGMVFDNPRLRFMLAWVLPLASWGMVVKLSAWLMRKRFGAKV